MQQMCAEKKWLCGVQQELLFTWPKRGSCWSLPPPPRPTHIKTKEKSHLKMLRLWHELCVVVCPCFLDDPAEKGPYLKTRKNKKTLCNQTEWSPLLFIFNRWLSRSFLDLQVCVLQSVFPHRYNLLVVYSVNQVFDLVTCFRWLLISDRGDDAGMLSLPPTFLGFWAKGSICWVQETK